MDTRSRDVDVVVVGAGGAGLAAALAAAEVGASVLLADAAGAVGGSTARSGGSFMAAGTEVQRAAGYTDDADAFLRHYLIANSWICDPAVARRFCDEGWPTMRWLIDHGVRYEPDGLYRSGGEPVPRSHRPVGAGQGVVDALGRACRAAGVDIALGNRVGALRTDGGTVVGVTARGEDVSAGAVVLTCGGFARSEPHVRCYYPELAATEGWWSPAAPTNVGDGLAMAASVGAPIVGFNDGVTVVTPGLSHDRDPFPPGWLVLVDDRGARFIDETAPSAAVSRAVRRHAAVWNVFDDRTLSEVAGGVWDPSLVTAGVDAGRIARAGTIEELARRAGIDGAGLAATVARYNEDSRLGIDRELLKDPSGMRTIAVPPFYAAPVAPRAMSLTTYGVRIDPDGRVLDAHGRMIPRLFAAGEVTGNVIGQHYLGGGNSVGSALVFGRLAGTGAAVLANGPGNGTGRR